MWSRHGAHRSVRSQYLEENLNAVNVKLSKEDVEEVRKIAQQADATHGERYPLSTAHLLYAETPAWK